MPPKKYLQSQKELEEHIEKRRALHAVYQRRYREIIRWNKWFNNLPQEETTLENNTCPQQFEMDKPKDPSESDLQDEVLIHKYKTLILGHLAEAANNQTDKDNSLFEMQCRIMKNAVKQQDHSDSSKSPSSAIEKVGAAQSAVEKRRIAQLGNFGFEQKVKEAPGIEQIFLRDDYAKSVVYYGQNVTLGQDQIDPLEIVQVKRETCDDSSQMIHMKDEIDIKEEVLRL